MLHPLLNEQLEHLDATISPSEHGITTVSVPGGDHLYTFHPNHHVYRKDKYINHSPFYDTTLSQLNYGLHTWGDVNQTLFNMMWFLAQGHVDHTTKSGLRLMVSQYIHPPSPFNLVHIASVGYPDFTSKIVSSSHFNQGIKDDQRQPLHSDIGAIMRECKENKCPTYVLEDALRDHHPSLFWHENQNYTRVYDKVCRYGLAPKEGIRAFLDTPRKNYVDKQNNADHIMADFLEEHNDPRVHIVRGDLSLRSDNNSVADFYSNWDKLSNGYSTTHQMVEGEFEIHKKYNPSNKKTAYTIWWRPKPMGAYVYQFPQHEGEQLIRQLHKNGLISVDHV